MSEGFHCRSFKRQRQIIPLSVDHSCNTNTSLRGTPGLFCNIQNKLEARIAGLTRRRLDEFLDNRRVSPCRLYRVLAHWLSSWQKPCSRAHSHCLCATAILSCRPVSWTPLSSFLVPCLLSPVVLLCHHPAKVCEFLPSGTWHLAVSIESLHKQQLCSRAARVYDRFLFRSRPRPLWRACLARKCFVVW